MEANLIKAVGLTTGIGGISLVIFFLLFREVIRKSIFPKLNSAQAYRLLQSVVILVTIVAIIGLGAWTYVTVQPNPEYEPGKLKVSDISVDDYRADHNANVDIFVSNEGNRPLSISRVRFTVLKVQNFVTLGMLNYSGKYDLDISNLAKVGDHDEVAVSQSLQPGEVDKFRIVLTARGIDFRAWLLKRRLNQVKVILRPLHL